MDKKQINEKLNEVFRDVFDDENISVNENTTAKDIKGWDSLMHITLVASVEDEFDIKFEMKEVTGMKNVGEMMNLIMEKLNK